jgi:twitching motility protein PilT
MAAVVNMINSSREDHIITVEDPIEYVFSKKKCVVNQRQAGKHTLSFANALRAALREDPDIVVIGELRDLETIQLAITAAETGHLVLGTLHTNNAVRTINRVLDVFPPKQQSQIRAMVSESLRAIISQRLIPAADGKRRVPAVEVLYVKPSVSNLIREEKTFQIRSVMQTGRSEGMTLLDDSIGDLLKAGTITKDAARRFAEDPKRFA